MFWFPVFKRHDMPALPHGAQSVLRYQKAKIYKLWSKRQSSAEKL
jgi:hypothetical protein